MRHGTFRDKTHILEHVEGEMKLEVMLMSVLITSFHVPTVVRLCCRNDVEI